MAEGDDFLDEVLNNSLFEENAFDEELKKYRKEMATRMVNPLFILGKHVSKRLHEHLILKDIMKKMYAPRLELLFVNIVVSTSRKLDT
jgi:hypothetical protein